MEFWTLAKVVPRVRVEEQAGTRIPLFPRGKARRHFDVFAYGTRAEPPATLAALDLRSTLRASWEGPARETLQEDGLIESYRAFAIDLFGEGDPGLRSAKIMLSSGGEELQRYPLVYEVAPAIKVSPSALVLSATTAHEGHVLIRSLDGRPFALQSATASLPGLKVEVVGPKVGTTHTLKVDFTPSVENAGKGGEVVVATDHPDQARVKIAAYVSSSFAAQREEPR